MKSSNSIGWPTATALVVANMIGAGIFSSLGFQLEATPNSWSILILWSSGAIMALCGAFSYAELGTRWPRSGGEYHFLSEAFHPMLGYLSGWVSLTIGFSAPVALAGMAIGEYVGPYLGIPGLQLALVVIIAISLLHSISIKKSSYLQNITTLLKLLLILFFICFGLAGKADQSAFIWDSGWKQEILLPAFAVSFIYVTFSYSGWNAAAYIVDEIRDASRNLPRALITGTILVSSLYLLLNFVFLKHNPIEDLSGELEIGQITANAIFGSRGGELISFGIGVLLLSGISAMVWAGPRVTQVMGEDHALWRWFSVKTKTRIPLRALWLQTAITIVLLLSGTFEQVMVYSGFVLQLFAALTVSAVFVARRGIPEQGAYKSPLFPLPQLVFLIPSLWILIYLVRAQPLETGLGLLNLFLGALVYAIDSYYSKSLRG
jgi:APA family basic amino acid/polyamine antiporter